MPQPHLEVKRQASGFAHRAEERPTSQTRAPCEGVSAEAAWSVHRPQAADMTTPLGSHTASRGAALGLGYQPGQFSRLGPSLQGYAIRLSCVI